MGRRRSTVPLAEKLRAACRRDEATGCLVYQGAKFTDGHGSIWDGERNRGAHCVAWEQANGRPVPKGLVVRHSCDNPPCCEPDHLLLGTHADNVADRVARGRSSKRAGEKNASAKLTAKEAAAIRTDTRPHRLIADQYGISRTQVSRIQRGERWAQDLNH